MSEDVTSAESLAKGNLVKYKCKSKKDSAQSPTIVNGYTVLCVASRLTPISFKERSAKFLLWFKKYKPEKNDQTTRDTVYRPKDKTIFVKGIPAFMNQVDLHRIFSLYDGEKISLNSVTLLPNDMNEIPPADNPSQAIKGSLYARKGYMQAYISYDNSEDVDKIIRLPKECRRYYINHPNSTKTELRKVWAYSMAREYEYDHDVLMDHYMSFMKQYDEQQEEMELKNKEISEVADEDGWVTVVRTKTQRPPKSVKAHELRSKKKKKRNIVHFYKHQATDSKLDRIKTLRSKFEEDKKMIAEMKQKRKFKPQ